MLTDQQTEVDFTTASPGDAHVTGTLAVSSQMSRKLAAYYTSIIALPYGLTTSTVQFLVSVHVDDHFVSPEFLDDHNRVSALYDDENM